MSARTRPLAAALLSIALAGVAHAGDFSVSPVRMELGAKARTGTFTIRNEGKERLSFQVQGMTWTQDAQASDRYEPAADLVYFPRLVTIEPQQDAVVRVGVREAVVQTEKTYRLFVEELPSAEGASPAPASGSQVKVLVRFGPPIFVRPVQPAPRLEVEQLAVDGGAVRIALRNAGNEHQLVESIRVSGTDARGAGIYDMTLADRYLLAGTLKQYSAAIPREQCLALRRLVVEVRTDKASARRELESRADLCR